MTIEAALVALLKANGAAYAQIGAREYPLLVPQDAARPALAYQRISNVPGHSHSGNSSLWRTRIQLTIEATSYAQARLVADLVAAALDCYHGAIAGVDIDSLLIENDTDGESAADQLPVVRMDLIAMHHG